MKFKQNEQEPKSKFTDLLQFKIEEIAFICSALFYFEKNEYHTYAKIIKCIKEEAFKTYFCLAKYVYDRGVDIPEMTIPAIQTDFENIEDIFKTLADNENKYITILTEMIGIAADDGDWVDFNVLQEKLNKVTHICSRLETAVKNNTVSLELCKE